MAGYDVCSYKTPAAKQTEVIEIYFYKQGGVRAERA